MWSSQLGDTLGVGIIPLVPGAPNISFRDPPLYHALALVDALRVGDAREREVARALLVKAIEQTEP